MRIAWLERDVLHMEQERARRTIMLRNWPKQLSAEQRWFTIAQMLCDAGIAQDSVCLCTPVYDTYKKDPNAGGWVKEICPISIVAGS